MRKNNIKGYALFTDISDFNLRAANRAAVMANIFEDNSRDGATSERGLALLKDYFEEVPYEDRLPTYGVFQQTLRERGYA